MIRTKLNVGWCTMIGVLLMAVTGAEARGPSGAQEPEVAARVGGKVITVQEVDARFLSANIKLGQQVYDARLKALDQLILERALNDEAVSKNIPVDTLIDRKLAAQAKPITDADVQNYYNRNKQRMRGKSLEQVSGQIRTFLASQEEAKARRKLLAQVKKNGNVTIMLEAPRAEVAIAANDPYKGSADAKVTIVEFSDFQ